MFINRNKWINLRPPTETKVTEVTRPNGSPNRDGSNPTAKSFSQVLKEKLTRRLRIK